MMNEGNLERLKYMHQSPIFRQKDSRKKEKNKNKRKKKGKKSSKKLTMTLCEMLNGI
jgi:hypothetical protein